MYFPAGALVPTVVVMSILGFCVFMTTYVSLARFYMRRDRALAADLERQRRPVRRLIVSEGRTIPVPVPPRPPPKPVVARHGPSGWWGGRSPTAMSPKSPIFELPSSPRKPSFSHLEDMPRRGEPDPSPLDVAPPNPAAQRSSASTRRKRARREVSTWQDNMEALRKIDKDFLNYPPPSINGVDMDEPQRSSGSTGLPASEPARSSHEAVQQPKPAHLSMSAGQSTPSNMRSPIDDIWSRSMSQRTSATTIRPYGNAWAEQLMANERLRQRSFTPSERLSLLRSRKDLAGVQSMASVDESCIHPAFRSSVASSSVQHSIHDQHIPLSPSRRLIVSRELLTPPVSRETSRLYKDLPPVPQISSPTLQSWGASKRRELEISNGGAAHHQSLDSIANRPRADSDTLSHEPDPLDVSPRSSYTAATSDIPRLSLASFGPDFPDPSITTQSSNAKRLEPPRRGSARSVASEESSVCTTSQEISSNTLHRAGSRRKAQPLPPLPTLDEDVLVDAYGGTRLRLAIPSDTEWL
ncbi:MAG: hypothetical protein M1817_002024 [Caeruleum heppii]|nr:MAG: hypothetical protein M1817_002024 [Caeruleum heppii]